MKKKKVYEDHKEPRYIRQYPTDGNMNSQPAKASNTWEQ
jgi:hypothetical protein